MVFYTYYYWHSVHFFVSQMVSVCSIQCFTFLVHLEYLLCLPVFRIRILTFFKVSFITISILRTGSGCGGDFWLGLELGLLWCSMQLAWSSSRHRRFTSSVDLPHAGRPFPWWYKLFHLQPSHSSSLPSSLDYGESQFSRPTLVPVSGSRVMLSILKNVKKSFLFVFFLRLLVVQEINFVQKFFLKTNKKWHRKKFWGGWVSKLWIFVLNRTPLPRN